MKNKYKNNLILLWENIYTGCFGKLCEICIWVFENFYWNFLN